MTEFVAYPKTPRLRREVVITEKIDGTNAAVLIEQYPFGYHADPDVEQRGALVFGEERSEDFMPVHEYVVAAQSRKRLITPEDDNFGFARWTYEHAESLVRVLGPGVHFGEWWGSGIQRGYGLEKGEKRFSLFNVGRWGQHEGYIGNVPGLGVVPVVAEGVLTDDLINRALADLSVEGSYAAPGFPNPEGIIVFHTQSRQVYKVLLENDEVPKGLVA